MRKYLSIVLFIVLLASTGSAQRIKDVAYFSGSGDEQLIGYGLVVGLAGTGDTHRSTFTVQSVTSMLKRFGITVPDVNLRTRNVAAVMVTARITNLLKPGSDFDVTVSSMGDASSLMGGQLLMTPLSSGITGSVFGFAQGPISIGGYDVTTPSGGRIVKNHATSGRIPGGGLLQMEIPGSQLSSETISVILRTPDFTTASNVAEAINGVFGEGTAQATDASEIRVTVPNDRQGNITGFLAELESITVETDNVAKVVLNERTGTIVSGNNVNILPVTISHGSLKISIKSFPIVSQPSPFSRGETVLYNNTIPYVEIEDSNNVVTIEGATNVQEVAAALNQLRVPPRDIIAIFQAIKESGSLPAELVIM